MAVYEYGVMANRPPIREIVHSAFDGTESDTLTFSAAMTRLAVKNTGTAILSFCVNGNPSLTDTLKPGETFDDEFPEFDHVIMSGATGSSYTVRAG